MGDSLNILIAALGSHGDVHPFLGIAQELRRRGHRVTIIAPAIYLDLADKLGFDFASVGTVEQFERFASEPDIWHPLRGFGVIAEGAAALLEPYYRAIAQRHVPGKTVLVIATLVFGGRVAQEKLGIPTVSVHLSPAVLRSVQQPPYLPLLPLASWQPAWIMRMVYALSDTLVIDRALAGPINAFRASLGLGPIRKVFDWMHSPDRVIGLFPPWFAPRAPDWPKQTVLTGFPLFDEAEIVDLEPGLARFLEEGEAPVAFTAGSAMRHGRGFFATAAEACRRLSRRGVLLSRHLEQIPHVLPTDICAVAYAPFSMLLPRCAALVHHGGIGTCAQALAAGVPQVAVPIAHDQPDNARRLQRLGVAEVVPAREFSTARATGAIERVLRSPAYAAAARRIRENFAHNDWLSQTAQWIERAHRGHA